MEEEWFSSAPSVFSPVCTPQMKALSCASFCESGPPRHLFPTLTSPLPDAALDGLYCTSLGSSSQIDTHNISTKRLHLNYDSYTLANVKAEEVGLRVQHPYANLT